MIKAASAVKTKSQSRPTAAEFEDEPGESGAHGRTEATDMISATNNETIAATRYRTKVKIQKRTKSG